MNRKRIPARHGQAEIEIKRSRFIADVWPVHSEEQVLQYLESIRLQHKKASHHVFAYRLDDDSMQRFSDDGEPGGTAGRPILDVIRGEDIHQVLIVITRYFGGTLLGSGGLVRAYSQAAREGLEAAGTVQTIQMVQCRITLPYELSGKADYYFSQDPLQLEDTEYGTDVTYVVWVPTEMSTALMAEWTDLSGGRAQCTWGVTQYRRGKL